MPCERNPGAEGPAPGKRAARQRRGGDCSCLALNRTNHSAGPPTPRHRALLAGLAESLRPALRPLLAEESCQASSVEDAAALVQQVRQAPPDLVLASPARLSVPAGELVRRIKGAAPQTIVIVTDPGTSVRRLIGAFRHGAYDVLLEPVDPADLRARVHHALERKRVGQALARRNRQIEEAARRRAREVLEVKRYLENLVESAGDAIITTSLGGRIASWNPSSEAIFGLPRAQAVGREVLALASGEAARRQLAELLDTARQGRTSRNVESVWRGQDGRDATVSLTVSPIRSSGPRPAGILVVARDITERQRLQEELLHAEKLASVGQLAAGVAHQINNPLGAIRGRVQMLARRSQPLEEARVRQQLGKIQADCDRIAETVAELLGFARKGETRMQHTDVNAALEETLAMVRHEVVAHKVRVVRRLDPHLPVVLASPNHLRQLFANLMINAFDAMGDRGTLTLESTLRQHQAGDPDAPPAVEAALRDTGTGIAEDALPHIFDPFYSTKDPGEGTGLGLAVARRIVDLHNGRITVESAPGKGTTFRIQLPVAPAARGPSSPQEKEPSHER